MFEIAIQIVTYFSTIFFSSLILILVSNKVASKTPNTTLLKKQLEVYKELYYNTVHDNLYNDIKDDKASEYLKKFYVDIISDRDYSMLFSKTAIIKIKKHISSGKWKFNSRSSLNNTITKDFNNIRSLLGYNCQSSYFDQFVLNAAKIVFVIIITFLLACIYILFTKQLPLNFEFFLFIVILLLWACIIGDHIYTNK